MVKSHFTVSIRYTLATRCFIKFESMFKYMFYVLKAYETMVVKCKEFQVDFMRTCPDYAMEMLTKLKRKEYLYWSTSHGKTLGCP